MFILSTESNCIIVLKQCSTVITLCMIKWSLCAPQQQNTTDTASAVSVKCWIGTAQVLTITSFYDDAHRLASLSHILEQFHQPLFSNITAAFSPSEISSLNGGCLSSCLLLDRLSDWAERDQHWQLALTCFDSDHIFISMHLTQQDFTTWSISGGDIIYVWHLLGHTSQIIRWELCFSLFSSWLTFFFPIKEVVHQNSINPPVFFLGLFTVWENSHMIPP